MLTEGHESQQAVNQLWKNQREQQTAELAALLPTQPEIKQRDPIEKRTGEALHQGYFEVTPELEGNIRDFFTDNYALAGDIETILTEDLANLSAAERMARSRELQTEVDNHFMDPANFNKHYESALIYGNMPPAISHLIRPFLARLHQDRLANPEDEHLKLIEIMMLAKSVEGLFAEPSVAISTVGEQERSTVAKLAQKLSTKIEDSGYFDHNGGVINGLQAPRSINMYAVRNPDTFINKAEETFWNDCRYAGQLLFHNSGDMPRSRHRGELLPRRMQQVHNGEMHIQTAERSGSSLHSPMIHWSEQFSADEYKGPAGSSGGTIAMPLWKIIHTAPYARDAHYGRLKVKADKADDFKEKVRLIDTTGNIGLGSFDYQGYVGTDRTFYSSPHDVEPDAPVEEAPDGHSFKLNRSDYAVVIGEDEMYTAMQSGLGESFPTPFGIDVPSMPDRNTWVFMSSEERHTFQETRQKAIDDRIRELQHESAARWPDEFVVPLRSGVMEFDIGDDGRYEGRNSAKFVRLPAA